MGKTSRVKPIGIKQLISLAFKTALKNYWFLAAIYFVGLLPSIFLMAFLPISNGVPKFSWLFHLVEIPVVILSAYANATVTYAADSFLGKKKILVIEALKNTFPKFWTYLVASMLAGFIMFAGFFY